MKKALPQLTLAIAAVVLFSGADWRHFRGTDSNSASSQTNLPKVFSDGKNVAWQVPLPGRGPASPIVVDGRVVVTCSNGVPQDRLHVLCFDADDGKLHWHRQLWATGHTEGHPFGAGATPTPASDGKRIFAFYSSNDLACFDLAGNLLWFRGLAHECPTTRNDVGMASSPLVVGDTVVVQLQNQGESFAAGIDTATGKTRWRIDREQDAVWSSPAVLRGAASAEDIVLLVSRSALTAHDPRTGEQLWQHETSCHTTASPTTCEGHVYLPANGLHRLKYDPATRKAELLWYESRLRSGNASPVVHDGRVYVTKTEGIVTCADVADGKTLWQVRVKGPVWATPVLADGHLYVVNHAGLVHVVRLGEKGELVGTNELDPGVLATPAVADGALFFRTDDHLWKVAFPSE